MQERQQAYLSPRDALALGRLPIWGQGTGLLHPGIACHSVWGFNLGPSLAKASSEEPLCWERVPTLPAAVEWGSSFGGQVWAACHCTHSTVGNTWRSWVSSLLKSCVIFENFVRHVYIVDFPSMCVCAWVIIMWSFDVVEKHWSRSWETWILTSALQLTTSLCSIHWLLLDSSFLIHQLRNFDERVSKATFSCEVLCFY